MRHSRQLTTEPGETAALVAIGSNLGNRAAFLKAAVEDLRSLRLTRLVRSSEAIETAPVGPPGQGPYLNAAALLATRLDPRELLNSLLSIEARHGRVRDGHSRWGPRTLDLDLILFGELTIREPGLTVPHPRLQERAFVLEPAASIAPDMPVPGADATIAALLSNLRHGSIA